MKRKLSTPEVLRRVVLAGEMAPRTKAPFYTEGLPQVFLGGGEKPAEIIRGIDSVWDAHFSRQFNSGRRVLIKINLNTADPCPASTCPAMLAALVGFLHEKGIRDIVVGDCSSVNDLPTRKVAEKTGISGALAGKAKIVCFDEETWVKVRVGGEFLQEVTVPKIIFEVDRIISLANLKTHRLADFTFGIKLSVGFMHPLERYPLHRDGLKQKVPEISLAVQPDLTIIDGRTAFVTGGPSTGRAEQAGVFIMGSNQLAVDVEAYRQLYLLKKHHGCLEHFKEDPFEMPQLAQARKCLPEGKAWAGYECVRTGGSPI